MRINRVEETFGWIGSAFTAAITRRCQYVDTTLGRAIAVRPLNSESLYLIILNSNYRWVSYCLLISSPKNRGRWFSGHLEIPQFEGFEALDFLTRLPMDFRK